MSFLTVEDKSEIVTVPCEKTSENLVNISSRSLKAMKEAMKNWDGRLVLLKTRFSEDQIIFSLEEPGEKIEVNLKSRVRRFNSFEKASDYLLEGVPRGE